MTDSAEARAKKIAGFRELIDFLEVHPEIPLPFSAGLEHCVTGRRFDSVTGEYSEMSDAEGAAEIERVAAELGEETVTRDGCVEVARQFGPVAYRAFYLSRQRGRDWEALISYRNSIKAD